MRFLVDENLPPIVTELLLQQGHDVHAIRDSNLRGSSDAVVWQIAANENRIVITRDLDFPLEFLPKPPGLVLLRVPSWFTSEQIGRFVEGALDRANEPDFLQKVTVLSPGREPRRHQL